MRRRGKQAVVVASFLVFLLSGMGATAIPQPDPPILFRHKIHVDGYRIDCRFCHSTATKSAYAGIPSVQKCMICHRVVATDRPEIRKVAQYWKDKKPIPWNRVVELPDYVYFPHFRMVNAGIPCTECHPGMNEAGFAVQRKKLTMGFCLACHKSRGVSIECWTCHI